MKREIKKVDVGSIALVYGALLAAIGLFFALLFMAFGSVFMGMMGKGDGGSAMFGGGIAMLIILPIGYGILGMILGAIFGVIYNLIAPLVGGIKVYVSDAA
jgi:hypothetical protein